MPQPFPGHVRGIIFLALRPQREKRLCVTTHLTYPVPFLRDLKVNLKCQVQFLYKYQLSVLHPCGVSSQVEHSLQGKTTSDPFGYPIRDCVMDYASLSHELSEAL